MCAQYVLCLCLHRQAYFPITQYANRWAVAQSQGCLFIRLTVISACLPILSPVCLCALTFSMCTHLSPPHIIKMWHRITEIAQASSKSSSNEFVKGRGAFHCQWFWIQPGRKEYHTSTIWRLKYSQEKWLDWEKTIKTAKEQIDMQLNDSSDNTTESPSRLHWFKSTFYSVTTVAPSIALRHQVS